MERGVGGTWRTAHRPRAGEVSAKGFSEPSVAVPGSGRPAYGRPPGASNAAAIPVSDRQLRSPTIEPVAIEIRPLTAKRIGDLATLFDQGGDPKWCWCSYFRVRGRNWTNATPEENRELLGAAARRRDHAPGLVAYEEDTVVGWVSLGPREDYERLAYSKVLAPLDDVPVWSIVCFVVGRKSRGHGVAGELLAAAIDYAREHGATVLEAYPVEVSAGERVPSASAYQGTLGMFDRAGFKVAERRQANKASPVRPIVRLGL
jgi:GNAT superfamily N-acetyltransferase